MEREGESVNDGGKEGRRGRERRRGGKRERERERERGIDKRKSTITFLSVRLDLGSRIF